MPAESDTEKISFILAHSVGESHSFHKVSRVFMDELRWRFADQPNVQYHPGGDLGGWVSIFEQVKIGTVQMAITWQASEFDRRLDLSVLGYLVDNSEDGTGILHAGGLMSGVCEKILADLDIQLIAILPDGFYGVVVRKGLNRVPTDFPDDGRGFKLRVPPMRIAFGRFAALGFSAAPMPMAELYMALQLGTVDGAAFQDPVSAWDMRDAIQHYVVTRDTFGTAFWIANRRSWHGVSTRERESMTEEAKIATAIACNETEDITNMHLSKLRDYGIDVVELSPHETEQAVALVQKRE